MYRGLLILEFNAELMPLSDWGYTGRKVMLEHLLVFLQHTLETRVKVIAKAFLPVGPCLIAFSFIALPSN